MTDQKEQGMTRDQHFAAVALFELRDHAGDLDDLRDWLASVRDDTTSTAGGWQPTHRHVKRGSFYRVLGVASLQRSLVHEFNDGKTLVIYEGEDKQLWARAESEFNDGRFEELPAAPTTNGEGKT